MAKTVPGAARRVLFKLETTMRQLLESQIECIREFGNEDPKTALHDVQDVINIHYLVEQGKYKKALKTMGDLDTFVRGYMPLEDTEFLIDLEEDKKNK